MKWPVEKKVATGFLAGFVLLGVIRFAAYEIKLNHYRHVEDCRAIAVEEGIAAR